MRLYDAPACSYCARVPLVLAENGCEVEAVETDLRGRPEHDVEVKLSALPVGTSLLSDPASVPSAIRLRERREVVLGEPVDAWLELVRGLA